MDEHNKTCKICGAKFDRLGSHISRTHNKDLEQYLIEFVHSGIRPSCACGCGAPATFSMSPEMCFKKFIHGHHNRGKKLSEETREKIGKSNRESGKIKQWFIDHPEEGKKRKMSMSSGITEESERRRIEASTRWSRTEEGKKSASDHAKKLWSADREKMDEAKKKANRTLIRNIELGLSAIGTEEWRSKISESITQKYLDGGFEWSRGIHSSPKTGRSHYYRSSWELRHMRDLDSDPSVKTWQYEPISIEYEWEGVQHRYIPDFLVTYADGRRELQEIGVKKLKDSDRSKKKQLVAVEWATEHGASFRIISF